MHSLYSLIETCLTYYLLLFKPSNWAMRCKINLEDTVTVNLKKDFGFQLIDMNIEQSVILEAKSSEEQADWVAAIKMAIAKGISYH